MTARTAPLAHPDRLFIGGEWIPALAGETLTVVNPTDETTFAVVAAADSSDIDRAVTAAREAFDHGPWTRMTHAERAGHLREMAAALTKRAGDFADTWTAQTGVLHMASTWTSSSMAGVFEHYASLADTFDFVEEHAPTAGGEEGFLVREPVGVVGAIIPWNSPLLLIAHKIAPALVAGCTVVLKASPEAPVEALLMAEIADEVGLPRGVLNVVTADREASERLVTNPDVDKITFTGSTAAGKRIASLCGERIARCTLELGGKSAAVILRDADIEAAAKSLAASAVVMTGQVCASLTRYVVDRAVHDDFAEAISAALAQVAVGDPFDASTGMGPLAMRRQWEKVTGYIEVGKQEGDLLVGGRRPAGLDRGCFIEPTVFAGVDNTARIAREEIFGPVVTIIPADDEADAVRIANDTPYGLNNSVFTGDVDRAWSVARRLRSGTVGHNAMRADFGIAFGGFKQSGIGREGGTEGLLPYLETKTVILDGRPAGL